MRLDRVATKVTWKRFSTRSGYLQSDDSGSHVADIGEILNAEDEVVQLGQWIVQLLASCVDADGRMDKMAGHWWTKVALVRPENEIRLNRCTVDVVRILPRIRRERPIHFHNVGGDSSARELALASLWKYSPTPNTLKKACTTHTINVPECSNDVVFTKCIATMPPIGIVAKNQ